MIDRIGYTFDFYRFFINVLIPPVTDIGIILHYISFRDALQLSSTVRIRI